MDLFYTGIALAALLVIAVLAPLIAVDLRDRRMRKQQESKREIDDNNLSLKGFQRRLVELYKEEFAIVDGRSYFSDPKTMDPVEEAAKIREEVASLKAKYPQYEGQYDDKQLYKTARNGYGDDVLMLNN